MYVINCTPLARGAPRGDLSYFSKSAPKEGSLVIIPLRKKEVPAIVTKISPAKDLKSDLRSSSFSLRKIADFQEFEYFDRGFIKAGENTAKYFSGSLGAVLLSFLPKIIQENAKNILSKKDLDVLPQKSNLPPDIMAIQSIEEERIVDYRQLIRESFARNESLYLCAPSGEEAEHFFENLKKGIEPYAYLFNSQITKKTLLQKIKECLTQNHPVLVVGTPSFLSIPRKDFKTLIIEKESSRFYKTQTSPYIDIRIFAEYLAKERGGKIIFGDTVLQLETENRIEKGEIVAFGVVKSRLDKGVRAEIIDIRKEEKKPKEPFVVFAEKSLEAIKQSRDSGSLSFVFCGRKGLSPLTVCADCGNAVLCKECKAPVVLYGRSGGNLFLCHQCGEKRSADECCLSCGSWKLQTLGIGIDLVEKELKSKLPGTPLFKLDKNSVKTAARAKEIADKFYKSKGGVLIGTEFAFLYLKKTVGTSVVASLDSLFAIPDFRIYEKIFKILTKLRLMSEKRCIFQTRNISADVFEEASRGSIYDFYKKELEMRRKFFLPPFSILIKLSFQGQTKVIKNENEKLLEIFKEYKPHCFESPPKNRDQKISNLIFYSPKENWPDQKILEKLGGLNPAIKIEIDPEQTV